MAERRIPLTGRSIVPSYGTMAGNYQAQMPVMAMNQIPNQQQMVSQIQQQDQSQMSQMQMQIYHHIQEQTSPILTGWQNSVMLAERYGHVSQMYVDTYLPTIQLTFP